MAANLVEDASDEPLSVDGTVFVSLPLPEGFPEGVVSEEGVVPEEGVVSEGELLGDAAVQ